MVHLGNTGLVRSLLSASPGKWPLSSEAVNTLTKRIKDKEDTMAYTDIIRARKNKESRHGLSEKQPAVLPEDEARLMELADAELDAVQGAGSGPLPNSTILDLH
jgi:mersacidin/lichenicidin family type 2 lantibiotic